MTMRRRSVLAIVIGLAVGAWAGSPAPALAKFGLAAPPRVTFHEPLDISYPQAVGLQTNKYEDPRVRRGLFLPLTPVTQAGSHPDLSIDFDFDTVPNPQEESGIGDGPAGDLRSLDVDLPPGFYANPTNYPMCDPATIAAREQEAPRCVFGSQVGVVAIELAPDDLIAPVYSVRPARGEPAQLTFPVAGVYTSARIEARTESDSGLTARLRGMPQNGIRALRMTLWGDPSAAVHDGLRWDADGYSPLDPDGFGVRNASGLPSRPFVTAPARCDAPLVTRFGMESWQEPGSALDVTVPTTQRTGCDLVPFAPSLTAQPSGSTAGQPVGMRVDLELPQTNRPSELATAQLRDATVTLPAGVAISPGGADGLGACSDGQFGAGSREPEACPDDSRIGSTTIDTPLLDEPLVGSVYLGEQRSQDPASGNMYRLLVTAYAKGVRIKLRGSVAADPQTGRLTAVFRQNPQLPFSALRLELKSGPRALLTNPTECGIGSVRLDASAYSGSSASSERAYVVDQGCPNGVFAPSFVGGTTDPFAGRFSPFTTTIARPDGDADLAAVRLDLPPGLLGAVGSVPLCAEAQAAAGTCGGESRVGSLTASVGTGPAPLSLPGTVSLAGPYRGAPFSLSLAIPAKAGPLDLGLVVVRAPLIVDAARAQVSAPVDALPQTVGGVPLHYRSISVSLDRPGFMFNATDCSAAEVVATLTSTSGGSARQSTRYQPDDCDRLNLRPALKLSYGGRRASLRKGRNPRLTAVLTQRFGEAGLERVSVTLPKISSLAPENAETLCSVAQFAARDCPSGSIVGEASAATPALPKPLTGPIFLVQGQRTTATGRLVRTLPKLFLKLEGAGVPLDLVADTSVDRRQRLVTTFPKVPDAPLSRVRLQINGGARGILTAVQDPCRPTRRGAVTFGGHNGARVTRSLRIAAPNCAIRLGAKANRHGVTVRLSNIATGTVVVRGRGLRRAIRRVTSGDSATLRARFSESAPRQIQIRVRFDPKAKGERTRTITRRLTVRGARG